MVLFDSTSASQVLYEWNSVEAGAEPVFFSVCHFTVVAAGAVRFNNVLAQHVTSDDALRRRAGTHAQLNFHNCHALGHVKSKIPRRKDAKVLDDARLPRCE